MWRSAVAHSGGRSAWCAAAVLAAAGLAHADEPAKSDPARNAEPPAAANQPAAPAKDAPPADAKPGKPPFAVVLKDARKIDGLIPLWRKDDKVFAELTDSLLGKEFFVLISIAKGIGDRSILGGMSLGFGDDWI